MDSKNHLFNDRLLRISIFIHSCLDDQGNKNEIDFVFKALSIENPLDPNLKKIIALILDSDSTMGELFWKSFYFADISSKKPYSPLSIDDIYEIMKIIDKSSKNNSSLIEKFKDFVQSNNLLVSSSNKNIRNLHDPDIFSGTSNAVSITDSTFQNNYLNQYKNNISNAFCLIHGISPYKFLITDTLKNEKKSHASKQALDYFQKKGLIKKIEDRNYLEAFEAETEFSKEENSIVEDSDTHLSQLKEAINMIDEIYRTLDSSRTEFAKIWNIEVRKSTDSTYESRQGSDFVSMFLLSLNYLKNSLMARSNFLSGLSISADELCLLVDLSTNKSITTDLKKGILKRDKKDVHRAIGELFMSDYARRYERDKNIYLENNSAKIWAKDEKRQYKFKETKYREIVSKDICLSDLQTLYKEFDKIFSSSTNVNEGIETFKKDLEAKGVDNIEERIAAGQYSDQIKENNGLDSGDRLKLMKALRLEYSLDKTFTTGLNIFYSKNKSIFDTLK